MNPDPVVMVEVGRADLEASLKVFLKLRKLSRVGVQGIVRFEAGELAIELGGASAVVKVSCSWVGEARFPGEVVLSLARSLPPGDPVRIGVWHGLLHVNGLSVPCVWQGFGNPDVILPVNATLSYVLALGVKYTGRDLAHRGVRKAIEDAEARADVLIHRAAKTLAKLEVTPDDLKRLVYKTVQHRHPNI
jgi:hypothetical protein